MESKMKLKPIFKRIKEEIDPNATASANALLLMDKLKTSEGFMKILEQIQMPTDKYKAIIKFADLLGIPTERFDDFMTNTKNQIDKQPQ